MSRDYETDEESQQSSQESMSEDDEESSQSSDQSSAEEDEGNEIKEHKVKPQPWKRIIHKAMDRHRDQLERMTNEYQHNGGSEEIAAIKATNAMLPVYRKELRKVLLEYLTWMHDIRKDAFFKEIMGDGTGDHGN